MSIKRYTCVQFDMDGTLIDSIPIVVESFQRAVFEVMGYREENEEILKNSIGLPLQQSFAHYSVDKQPALQAAYIKINDELQKNGVPLFEGVENMLAALHQRGIRLAVVTSKRLVPTQQLLKVMHMDSLFETVVGKEMTDRHKPFGDPIVKCMEIMGIKEKGQILYVGDSIHDIKCARDAGVDVAAVQWTKMDKEELNAANPDFWLQYPEDIFNHV